MCQPTSEDMKLCIITIIITIITIIIITVIIIITIIIIKENNGAQ